MNSEIENITPIEKLTKYFANEASAEEISWIENWRDSSSENRKEFDAIKKLWNLTDISNGAQPVDIDLEWKKMEFAITPVRTIRYSAMRIIAIAASVALVAILSIFGLQRFNTTIDKTDIAQVKEVKLPDGSVIHLNANSRISYKEGFGTIHREIKLTGEAYFEVVSGKDIPFVITAGEAAIEVVGTRFNVKAYKNQEIVKVTVSEGTVRLSDTRTSEKHLLVQAGETGKFSKVENTIEKSMVVNENDIAWKTRIIHFSDTPLLEVAQILSNTYHLDISVDKNISTCTITVGFKDKNLTEVLHIIQSTFNLRIEQTDDKIIISGQGCNPI